MSDRIGVMRLGRLVQVGTPERDLHRAQQQVRLGVHRRREHHSGARRLAAIVSGPMSSTANSPRPARSAGFSAGHLVVRPEFAAHHRAARGCGERADRHSSTTNMRSGSRIQYQVRVGDQVFIVERLRQQALTGRLDTDVLIGWNARDSILVRRLMAARRRRQGAPGAAERGADHPVPDHRFRGAAAGRHRLQLHAGADLQPVAAARPSQLRHRLQQHQLHLVPVVAGPRRRDRRAAGADLLSGRLWPRAGVRPLVDALDACCSRSRCSCRRTCGSMAGSCSSSRTASCSARSSPCSASRSDSWLFTEGIIVLGMVYVYLPFMLFPMTLGVSMVPKETRDAAFDLGADALAGVQGGRSAAVDAGHHDRLPAVLRAGGRRDRRGQGAGRAEGHPDHPRYRDRLHLCAELAARLGLGGAADAGGRRRWFCWCSGASTSTSSWGGADEPGGAIASVGAAPCSGPGRSTVVVFMYLPALCLLLASSTSSRYFIFPITQMGRSTGGRRPSTRSRSISCSRPRSRSRCW